MKIVQFYLNKDFFEKIEKENYDNNLIISKIEKIAKKNGFECEIDGIYKSKTNNSVAAVLFAQELIREIPFLKIMFKILSYIIYQQKKA